MRIAVTGVTGFIGRHLAGRALAQGHEVVGLSRRPWTGPPHVALDDRHFLTLPGLPAAECFGGVDALVHLAAATQAADPVVSDAVNRLGSERLFAAARAHGVDRIVFVSSQSAHADATSSYARSKLAVEKQLAGASDAIVVRPGLVYGDTDDGLMGRVTRTASRVRVVPVVGGATARVQTIHVDVLGEALLRLCTMDDPPRRVELADPDVQRLDAALREETDRRFGRRPLTIAVPASMARAAVRAARRVGVTLPVSEDSIDGVATFRPMATADDLASLGLAGVHDPDPSADDDADAVEPRRVLLVGAGRVGMIHAPTAMQHQRMVLCGVVDRNRSALDRLTAVLSDDVAAFTDLDAAIESVAPDAAIVATPPSSHLPVTCRLLEAGVDVLIEKPITATPSERAELLAAVAAHPERYVSTGYLSGTIPHVAAIADDLRAGRYGTPRSFEAFAFVTRIAGKAGRQDLWEFDPAASGGGALVNLGVHMLGMIDLLLGPTEVERARLAFTQEREVEDGAALDLRAGDVHGMFVTGWHVDDFHMPAYSLRIETDRGVLILTASCIAFLGADDVSVVHQVDVDRGFDLAPMDAGGAFWAEQDLLARRVPGPNSLELATRVESLIERVYADAERVSPEPDRAARSPAGGAPSVGGERNVVLDVRDAPDERVQPSGAVLLDSTLAARHGFDEAAIVSVPDATSHFRTFTNQGPAALARELGISNLGAAALGVRPGRAVSATTRSWEALLVLLRAELRRLDREVRGCVLVDAYLVDLATATAMIDPLRSALAAIRRRCSRARVGIEANATARLAPWLPELASLLDVVVVLGTTEPASVAPVIHLLPDGVELVVKTGSVPPDVAALAWEQPERWTHGDHRLVVPWNGAPSLRALDERRLHDASVSAGLKQA